MWAVTRHTAHASVAPVAGFWNALFALAFVVGCGGAGSGAKDSGSASGLVGKKAPSFDLPAQSGAERISMESATGHVVLVDFWATWCEPCRESFPHYQALLDRFHEDLVIIGVSVDDEPDMIASFAKETGVSFPLAWDRDKSVAQSYEPPSMPTSFLVDREGIVRRVHPGYHDGDENKLAGEIEYLLR